MTTFHPGGGGSSLTSGHAELVSASHNKEIPKHLTASPTDTGSHNSCLVGSLCKVRNDKYVSEAHSKELNVLMSYRLNDFKKKVAFTLAEGATQRICTRTERSEFVPASKTTLLRAVHNPRHVDMSDNIRRVAFTLAEVLITLAIIGVVAAMTIPTLISNYKEKQTVTKLQKVYATLKNAFEMSKVDHGDYETWYWNNMPAANGQRTIYFWETYIFPYLKVSKKCFPASEECLPTDMTFSNGSSLAIFDRRGAFILPDGTSIYTWAGNDDFYPHVWVYADLNGKAKPNMLGKDIFVMFFSPNNPGMTWGTTDDDGNFIDTGITFEKQYGFNLYGDTNGVTIDDLLNPNFILSDGSKSGCSSKGLGYVCGAVIKLNGWKVPDNYPFKF